MLLSVSGCTGGVGDLQAMQTAERKITSPTLEEAFEVSYKLLKRFGAIRQIVTFDTCFDGVEQCAQLIKGCIEPQGPGMTGTHYRLLDGCEYNEDMAYDGSQVVSLPLDADNPVTLIARGIAAKQNRQPDLELEPESTAEVIPFPAQPVFMQATAGS